MSINSTERHQTLREILFPMYANYNDRTKKVADHTLNKVKVWLEQERRIRQPDSTYPFADLIAIDNLLKRII